MSIVNPNYKPKWWLRNGHINTMYPYLYRNQSPVSFIRERWQTADMDFIDLDMIYGESKELVILSHGLEGSSSSQYIQSIAKLLSNSGYDVCALNYRSCSGDMNRTATMYHSGFTMDLDMIITKLKYKYCKIHLVGFSLGGNMNLKYTTDGIYTIDSKISSVVAVSVPCDLAGSSDRISSWYNYLYQYKFLETLLAKMKTKAEMYPNIINANDIKKSKNSYRF